MLVLDLIINLVLLILDIGAIRTILEKLLTPGHKVINLVHLSQHVIFDHVG
jgi:hypothetical protein